MMKKNKKVLVLMATFNGAKYITKQLDSILSQSDVDDHASALLHVALNGVIGETYNIGGNNELQNIEVVKTVCGILDKLAPSKLDGISKYEQLITYVDDRAGHDFRYAIDATKIMRKLNWIPNETFTSGIKKTVEWYLKNKGWCDRVKDGSYQGQRLGVVN